MVLKKQTIWLLTMLSLIVVLSVYYVQTPSNVPGDEVALVGEEEQNPEQEKGTETTEELDQEATVVDITKELDEIINDEGLNNSVISNVTADDTFATLRMELQATRDRLAEENTQVVTSTDTSAMMKSEAHSNNLNLIRLAQNEVTLETLIKAKGYDDALVMAEEDQVRIIVQVDELSKAEANEILHLTFDRLGNGLNVAVTHQNTTK